MSSLHLLDDLDAQKAYDQLWDAHPELQGRYLGATPEDFDLWAEWAEYYQPRAPISFDPHTPQREDEVLLRTGVVTSLRVPKWQSAKIKVTPEIAGEILKNLADKKPPFRPDLGRVGRASWFIIESDPYTGTNTSSTIAIDAEVTIDQRTKVYSSEDLSRIRDALLTPELEAEIKAQVESSPAQQTSPSPPRNGSFGVPSKPRKRACGAKSAKKSETILLDRGSSNSSEASFPGRLMDDFFSPLIRRG